MLALLGILINHLAESFLLNHGAGSNTWLADPAAVTGSVAQRFEYFWASDGSPLSSLAGLLAWVGNETPGVFILFSGFGLALSMSAGNSLGWFGFMRRRVLHLYPLYLASVLLFVPVWLLLAPNINWNMSGWPGLAMLSGVRATPEVFGLLNPSWWFFWTILQLYVVFPMLWWLGQKWGFAALLAGSVLITVTTRWYFLQEAGQTNLWPWLVGLFAATRVAEFVFGIWLANMLTSRPAWQRQLTGLRALLIYGAVFVSGVAASMTIIGTTISQLFLTIGLSGLLLGVWQSLSRIKPINRLALRLEPSCYGIYLIHQPPLIILAKALGQTWFALLAGLVWIALTPLFVRFLQWLISAIDALLLSVQSARIIGISLTVASFVLLFTLPVVEPYLGDGKARDLLTWLLAVFFVLTLWFNLKNDSVGKAQWLRLIAASSAALALWVFPDRGAAVACLAAAGAGAFIWLTDQFLDQRIRHATSGLLAIAVFVTGWHLEGQLRESGHRYEAGRWGELPVLQIHPTRGYALKPNVDQQLTYHYQYQVKTNADGFQGRPITARPRSPGAGNLLRIAVLGDAYTMPEAVPYPLSYTALLEKKLQHCIGDRRTEVFNLGVTGYSPTEKSVLINEVLPRIEPDLVIDQIFIAELDWMQMSATERRREIGLQTIKRPDYRTSWMGTQLFQKALRSSGDMTAMYAGLPARWRYETSLVGYFRTKSAMNGSHDDQHVSLTRYWNNLRSIADKKGYQIVAFYTPAAMEVSAPGQLDYLPDSFDHPLIGKLDMDLPFRRIAKSANSAGIALLDPRRLLRSAALRGAQVYSPEYWHWTAAGHAAAASAITTLLARQGFIPTACEQQQAIETMSQTN